VTASAGRIEGTQMRQVVAYGAGVLLSVVLVMTPGLPPWLAAVGIAALGLIAWRLGRCPHEQPLGLLPATTDLDGTPLPTRWFCDRCGKTWPAVFERTQTPVWRFRGYDESKAHNSARRAEQLAERQRELALRRAGFRKAKRPTISPARAAVVPFGQRRQG
jgi:hypothetical protein